MISQSQIERMLRNEAYDQLVSRVLSNGRCRSHAVRARLTSEGASRPAALGLALQRVCEISCGPGRVDRLIAHRLLGLQRVDGLFGSGAFGGGGDRGGDGGGSLAASAVALRGLADWAEIAHRTQPVIDPHLEDALSTGVRAIVHALDDQHEKTADHLDAQIACWQLAALPRFRRAIGEGRLLTLLHTLGVTTSRDDVARLALAAAA